MAAVSEPAHRGRVLGIDLGSRRIGLALSDPDGVIASPHGMIERSRDRAVDHAAILAAAREAGAVRLVVGLPLSLSGRVGPAAKAVLDEVAEIRAAAGPGLPVDTCDERLTTVVAERALGEARLDRRKRRTVVDQVAASVMLQSWLEANR